MITIRFYHESYQFHSETTDLRVTASYIQSELYKNAFDGYHKSGSFWAEVRDETEESVIRYRLNAVEKTLYCYCFIGGKKCEILGENKTQFKIRECDTDQIKVVAKSETYC